MVGNIRVMSPLNAHGLLLPTYLVSQGVEYTLSLRHPWRIPQGTKSQFLIKKVSFSQVAIENCRHPEGGKKKKNSRAFKWDNLEVYYIITIFKSISVRYLTFYSVNRDYILIEHCFKCWCNDYKTNNKKNLIPS